jgi:hypothetical protein
MRLFKFVISFTAIFLFVFLLNYNVLYAAECVPEAQRKVECGGVAFSNPGKSYSCMPAADPNDPNASNFYKEACIAEGGVYDEGQGKFETCPPPLFACCIFPVCIEAGMGTADATATPGATGGSSAPKPVPQTGSTAEWDYGGRFGGLQLVSCTKSGDCTIQDMVQQGIYFANFLIGLSGALFLIAFIWGGTMYLLSFGRDAWVTKGRDAMVKSAIGIVLIMLAWTIVTYVASSLGYAKFN